MELASLPAPFMPPRRASTGMGTAAVAKPDEFANAQIARLIALAGTDGEPADDDPPVPGGLGDPGTAP